MLKALRTFFTSPSKNSLLACEAIAGGATLIDVRGAAEFAADHLPGAINVPLASLLQSSAKDLLSGKENREVVVYCLSGMRSAQASKHLSVCGQYRIFNGGGRAQLCAALAFATSSNTAS